MCFETQLYLWTQLRRFETEISSRTQAEVLHMSRARATQDKVQGPVIGHKERDVLVGI